MSLNAYIAIGLALVVLFSPLIVVTSPIWGVWLLWQIRQKKRQGYLYLWPFMAKTIARYAEAMIGEDPPPEGWIQVARRLDAYLDSYRSRRKWRLLLVAAGLEFVPVFAFRLPFSWMSLAGRRAFCMDKLRTSRGVWGKVAMGKQLIRLGYYCDERTYERMGFVKPKDRPKAVRQGSVTPGQRVVPGQETQERDAVTEGTH